MTHAGTSDLLFGTYSYLGCDHILRFTGMVAADGSYTYLDSSNNPIPAEQLQVARPTWHAITTDVQMAMVQELDNRGVHILPPQGNYWTAFRFMCEAMAEDSTHPAGSCGWACTKEAQS